MQEIKIGFFFSVIIKEFCKSLFNMVQLQLLKMNLQRSCLGAFLTRFHWIPRLLSGWVYLLCSLNDLKRENCLLRLQNCKLAMCHVKKWREGNVQLKWVIFWTFSGHVLETVFFSLWRQKVNSKPLKNTELLLLKHRFIRHTLFYAIFCKNS